MYNYLTQQITLIGIIISWTLNLMAGIPPSGFIEEQIATGLNPVAMTQDHHGRLWLVEKHGEIRIVDASGQLLPDPVIQLSVDDFNERGLLGIALHPDMDNFPYMYLYYTVPNEKHNRVSRFTVFGDLAVPGSEMVLMDLDSLYGFVHNGGGMFFGNDGMLYIATGEASHPPAAQDLNSTHGKILRISPDGGIPSDNPFFNTNSGNNRAIWAYGLRNPFSLGYDAINDRIFACDVGGGEWEEVNEILPGRNYGWPLVEGPIAGQTVPEDYQDPFFAYPHSEGCAIVGAAFQLGNNFPEAYQNQFFFADYCEGYVKAVDVETGLETDTFMTEIERPLAMLFDEMNGSMYYLSRPGIGGGSPADNSSTVDGVLWRVTYTGSGAPFISVSPKDVLAVVGEPASFHVSALGDQPLTYAWQKDGISIPGGNSAEFILPEVSLADSGLWLRCIVNNSEGSDTSEAAMLWVTSRQRPNPIIQSPGPSHLFEAGETIFFEGYAIDELEDTLAASKLIWWADWHHNDHTHPGFGALSGAYKGSWTVPTIAETDSNVWYRLYLSATNDAGLSQTVYRDIYPRLVPLVLTGPKGLLVNIDGRLRKLPVTVYSLSGLQRVFQAPDVQIVEDSLFLFQHWGDGNPEQIHTFFAPEMGDTYSLQYESVPIGNGSGLWGEYFDDPELDLDGVPDMERLDTTINFLWGASSPAPNLIPNDYFTARWTGEVQAMFGGAYTFYVRSDDGCRLWINDQLIIDQWNLQAPSEFSGTLTLEEGKKYPIRLEYLEVKGGAEISFSWSNERIPKELVPKRQLYPAPFAFPAHVKGFVWNDQNVDQLFDWEDEKLEEVAVALYWAEDTSLLGIRLTDSLGKYRFDFLQSGLYFLQFSADLTGKDLRPGIQLDLQGRTEPFFLNPGEGRNMDVFFTPVETPEHQLFSQARAYPIPVTDRLTLEFVLAQTQPLQITLQDQLGRRLKHQLWLGRAGLNRISLDFSNYSPGMYYYRVYHELEQIRGKVLKRP